MSAVITKKRAKARTSMAAESAELARYLAGHLSAAMSISESAFHNWPVRDQLDRAVCILGRVADPETFEAMPGTPDGDLPAMLQAAKEALDLEIADIGRDASKSLCCALHDGILTRHIRDCLIELIDAFDSGAEGIEQLRRLATFQGAMGSMFLTQNARPQIVAEEAVLATGAAVELDESPRFLMGQALAVLQSAAESDGTSDAIWGLRNLAVLCDERVSQALEGRRPIDYDEASAALASMIDLMGVLDAEKAGGTLFYAALTLLRLTQTEIDAQWHALEPAEREAEHA